MIARRTEPPAGRSEDRSIGRMLVLVAIGSLVIAVLTGVVYRQHRRLQTDRQEIDRLKHLARQRADQVSVLSHEIRTPLALIRGSADLLNEQSPGPLTATQQRFVSTISRSAAHVIDLAEDLLTQARIEAGLFEVSLRRIELRSFMRHVVVDLRRVHNRRIVLDAPGPPTRVLMDPQLIRQLVTNVVANSVRHGPDPAQPITVRAFQAETEVVISVIDEGKGMTEAERQDLFRRFHSTAPLGEGTGLGLYISRQIAALHGGEIRVDTIADHGTTMMITFPAGTTIGPGHGS